MKVWNSFGSEHSMKLVIIGQFKTVADATTTIRRMTELEGLCSDLPELGEGCAYPDSVLEYLSSENLSLPSKDVADFQYCHNWRQDEDKIVVETDEQLFEGLLNVMLAKGARIEMYSRHDYSS
jgi:hypothetical protein